MDNIKVRALDGAEEKSVAEREEDLLKKAGQEQEETTVETTEVPAETPVVSEETKIETPVEEKVEEKPSLTEEEVLSFIGNRYGEEISSLDDLTSKRNNSPEIPEEVINYLNYKKETGRGLEDFIQLNRDVNSMDEDQLLFEFWKQQKPHLDSDDVDFELSERFAYDEESDEASVIRKRKIAKKEELAKAKDYFNNLKETYKTKVESTKDFIPAEELKDFEAYKTSKKETQQTLTEQNKRSEYFAKKTNELFNDNFEGFEFKLNDKVMKYKPADSTKLKDSQSDINNFISKHLSEEGYLKDAASYHKSLSLAMHPDSFAKFFYEQGKSDAVNDITKESKNIDMNGIRNATQSVSSGGFKVTAVSSSSGSGLRIKSNKNKN
jgi:hypothetical protein|tara:strand:+ start:10471 stop:11610 length:1140 start_codon:yes stop_codon:yes gene_type:complete